jgi:hypothetical protein
MHIATSFWLIYSEKYFRIKDEFTGFYRGKVLFTKVQQEELYFLNDNGSFVKFKQPVDRSSIHINLARAYNTAVRLFSSDIYQNILSRPLIN